MTIRALFNVTLLGLSLSAAAISQTAPPQPVQWSASLVPAAPIRSGSKVSIDLSAHVQDGWHVYSLAQSAGGPIPLRIAIDENDVAQIAGNISGTTPIKRRDESFQVETQFYEGVFVLHVPVAVKLSPAGNQQIPLSLRFQACSDRICLPPRTVHISVPIEVLPGD